MLVWAKVVRLCVLCSSMPAVVHMDSSMTKAELWVVLSRSCVRVCMHEHRHGRLR